MVLTHIAWAAIVTSASMVSYDLQVKSVAYSSTLLFASGSLQHFNNTTEGGPFDRNGGTAIEGYCDSKKAELLFRQHDEDYLSERKKRDNIEARRRFLSRKRLRDSI